MYHVRMNNTQTPSTPLTRACEAVLKAHSGELVITTFKADGTKVATKAATIAWAIDRLKFALKHPRLSEGS